MSRTYFNICKVVCVMGDIVKTLVIGVLSVVIAVLNKEMDD